MRTVYRVLAMLIAFGVVVQLAVIAAAWFLVLNDLDSGAVLDKNSEYNWAQQTHSVVGMMIMPVVALLLLIVSFFARIPGGVMWAAFTLGMVALQIMLAFASFSAPVLGLLHGLNALAVASVASTAATKARQIPAVAPAEPVATVAS